MRAGRRKRRLAVMLIAALLVTLVPWEGRVEAKAADSEVYQYMNEWWEDFTATEDIEITTDVNVFGRVTLQEGAKIVITSGSLVVNSGACIEGDVVLENDAVFECYGEVKGTLFIQSSGAAQAREDWEGNYTRPNNVNIGAGAYIEEIEYAGHGFNSFDGRTSRMVTMPESTGDIYIGSNAVIATLLCQGDGNVFNYGQIERVEQSAGMGFSNENNGYVESALVTGGYRYNNNQGSYTGSVYVTELGAVSNSAIWDDNADKEGYIDTVVIQSSTTYHETDEKYGEYEAQAKNLENSGTIDNLIVYGGSVTNMGTVHNAYVKDCSDFLAVTGCDWFEPSEEKYSIEKLMTEDSVVVFESWGRGVHKNYGKVSTNGGMLSVADAVVEDAFIQGSYEQIYLNNCEFYTMYIDADSVSGIDFLQVANPRLLNIGKLTVSSDFFENNQEVINGVLTFASGGKKNDGDLWELFMKVEDYEPANVTAEVAYRSADDTLAYEQEQAITISEGDIYVENSNTGEAWFVVEIPAETVITLKAASQYTMTFVRLVCPDGTSRLCASSGEADSLIYLALEAGIYYISVIGAEYGATLSFEPYQAPYLAAKAQYSNQAEENEVVPVTEGSLKDFVITIYDQTAGQEFEGYVVEDDRIYFTERPEGHTMQLTASCKGMEWKYPALSETFVFDSKGKMQLELHAKEFGIYRGNVMQSEDVRIYVYDAAGKYYGSIAISEDWFWSDYMPNGEYTAVFIRDAGGSYRFSELSCYEEYGMENHVDYIADHFVIEAGSRSSYYNVQVPSAPQQSSEYFETSGTAFRTNSAVCAVGGIVQMTLSYQVKAEYTEKAEQLQAVFELAEGTQLCGEAITVNGVQRTDYVYEDGRLKIALEKMQGTVSMMVEGTETAGNLSAMAFVHMFVAGKRVEQYIGSIGVEMVQLTLQVPNMTAESNAYVYGIAVPGAEVVICEDGTIVGSAVAKANGSYTAQVSLLDCDSKREHTLQAVMNRGTSEELVTEQQTIIYNRFAPTLEQFTLNYFVHGQKSSMTLTGEEFMTKSYRYEYWPGSIFTFEVRMSGDENLSRVYIVSRSDGNEKSLEAFYDESSDLWIATGQFSEDENYVPYNFYIKYVNKSQKSDEKESIDLLLDDTSELDIDLDKEEIVSEEYDENRVSFESRVHSDELNMDFMLYSSMEVFDAVHTPEELLAMGFDEMTDENGRAFYCKTVCSEALMGTFTYAISFYSNDELEYEVEESELEYEAEESELQLMLLEEAKELKEQLDGVSEVVGLHVFLPDKQYNKYAEAFEYTSDALEGTMDLIDELTGISESIIEMNDTWLDIKDYSAQYDAYMSKIEHIQQLTDALKELQRQYPNSECAKISADGLTAGLNDLGNRAKALMQKQIANKVLRTGAKIGAEQLAKKLKIADKALKMVKKTNVGQTTMRVYTKIGAVYKKMVKDVGFTPWQQRVWDYAEEKVVDYAKEKVEEGVNNVMEKGKEMLYQYDPERALEQEDMSIGGQLDQIEKDVMDTIKKCRATPTPTLILTMTPTPTPTGENTPTAKPTGTPSTRPVPTGTPEKRDEGETEGKVQGPDSGVEIDPSGYVYAGITDNRLQGVKATVYYQDEQGEPVLWNAEEYEQSNPLYTSAQGTYSWMVPPGAWKVVYELEGYETYETEWLPVPPPQTEVNINLMAVAAPVVKELYVNEDYAYFRFDMYVQTDSVTGKTVLLKDQNGKQYSGTIEPVNAVADPEGTMLADSFRLVYTDAAPQSGSSCTLTVQTQVKGYNGKNVTEHSTQAVCQTGVEELTAEWPMYLLLGEECTVSVKVKADVLEGLALWATSDEELVEVRQISEVTSDGMAKVSFVAKKPGACIVRIGVEGSEKMLETTVYCARETDAALIQFASKQDVSVEVPKQASRWWMWIALAVCGACGGAVGAMHYTRKKNVEKNRNQ
ncbi:MAG: hypothetical protein IJY09_08815 [Lachnospiraceae bacterium]|nr:hypothetical protein [Lachnospiraceae bacterium]